MTFNELFSFHKEVCSVKTADCFRNVWCLPRSVETNSAKWSMNRFIWIKEKSLHTKRFGNVWLSFSPGRRGVHETEPVQTAVAFDNVSHVHFLLSCFEKGYCANGKLKDWRCHSSQTIVWIINYSFQTSFLSAVTHQKVSSRPVRALRCASERNDYIQSKPVF